MSNLSSNRCHWTSKLVETRTERQSANANFRRQEGSILTSRSFLFAYFEVLLRRRNQTQHYHLWVGSGQAIDSMIQDRINRVIWRLSARFFA